MSDIVDIELTYTKAELLEALDHRRLLAVEQDAAALAEHQRQEKQCLANFRRACREALKWDYDTAKGSDFNPARLMEDSFEGRYGRFVNSPSCPPSIVSKIDSLVAMIEKLRQDRFVLSRGGKWAVAYSLLTDDVPQITGLC